MKYWININQITAKQRDKHVHSAKCWTEASWTLHRQNNQWALQARYKVVQQIVRIHVLGIRTLESWSAYDVLELAVENYFIQRIFLPRIKIFDRSNDLWLKKISLLNERKIFDWCKTSPFLSVSQIQKTQKANRHSPNSLWTTPLFLWFRTSDNEQGKWKLCLLLIALLIEDSCTN